MKYWYQSRTAAFACLLFFFSCKNQAPSPNSSDAARLDSLLMALEQEEQPTPAEGNPVNLPTESTSGPPAKITVQDDLHYSKTFLGKLAISGLASSFDLADSLLIVDKMDTIIFPVEMPLRQWTNFIAVKSGTTYSLDVAKLNYTTLGFNFELRMGNKTVDQITGKADLSPAFYLGSESDEDPQTGNTYFCNEYYFENESCTFNIRLGDDEGIRKVKIIKNCKAGKYNINLDNCPVLLEN